MVTLTGTFTRLDGTPAAGMVRVTPSRSPILDTDGRVVISGPQTFALDKDGKLTTEIPASNDPDLGAPFTFTVAVELTHASWKISKVWIPHGSATVDLSEIGDYQPTPGVATRTVTIPADGTDGQVLVWDGAGFSWDFPPEGPQGPPGEVTTAALTTALAGKVTGQGMSVRVDTTVGTRVLLDHPGGTTMLYGDTGWRTIYKATAGLATYGTLPTGWAIGYAAGDAEISIRRVTDRILIRIFGVKRTTGGTSTLLILPTGFAARPQITTLPCNTAFTSTIVPRRVTATGTAVVPDMNADDVFGQSNNPYPVLAEFIARDSWPTSQPGQPGTP